MIPSPTRTTTHPIKETFIALSNNEPLPADMCLVEAYYFTKAHKLVALDHFMRYWNDGRSKQVLIDILKANYPPLEYNHALEDGYESLGVYVEIARSVFSNVQISEGLL